MVMMYAVSYWFTGNVYQGALFTLGMFMGVLVWEFEDYLENKYG
jgi:hypothetical protein